MAVEMDQGVRQSRMRVPRSRGAFSGISLVVLGAWAALVPFIGPYFSFAFLPAPNDAWHWTAGRGWLEVAPGAAAFVAGILLLIGTHRVNLGFASWLGVASGAWLVVGPIIAPRLGISAGAPASATPWVQTLEELFFFFAVGAAIVFFAASALGRMSVQSVRDARAAQRRAELEAERQQEERRLAEERMAAERGRENEAGYRRDEQAARLHEHQGGDARAEQWADQREAAAAEGRGDTGATAAPDAAAETREYPAQHTY